MFGRTLSSILIGVGKAKLSGLLLATAAIQYLVSIFILVPIFGINGAAISLTLTGITSLILIPIFIRRNLKIEMFPGLHKLLSAGAVSAAILLLLPKDNPIVVAIGTIASMAAYVAIVYYTGYIDKEDIDMLRNPGSQV